MGSRFSSFRFKNGLEAKNRIVVPAMASSTADRYGFATSDTVAHYQRLSLSGAGIIFAEYTFVHASGRSENNQLGIDNDLQVSGLKNISRAIKASGALAGIQLTHSGGKSSRELTQGRLMGPSNIPVPVKGEQMEEPTPMTFPDLELWKQSFILAAERAVSAGFDLVELHAAHGYGLNQWLSPITNKREDSYGGALENRLRLLSEILSVIKLNFPNLLLSVRIPGRDFLEDGLSVIDSIQSAKHLEQLGVDLINVSSGIGGWRRPSDRTGEGYLVPEAAAIQGNVEVPVIGVGGIESGGYVDNLICQKTLAFAAIGRAILADPKAWGERELSGNALQHCLLV
jgi:NADPH2 dehydrogenase